MNKEVFRNMSFLIVKTSAIGDVIQTFPVLEYLRERFPDSRIDWVVEKNCDGLVRAHPFLDHVHLIDTKSWRKTCMRWQTWKEIRGLYRQLSGHRYDVVFDLQGNTKSALMTAMAKADKKVGFGFRTVPEKPNVLATTRRFDVPGSINARLRYLKLVQNYFRDENTWEAKGVLLHLDSQEQQRLEEILAHPHLQKKELIMVSFGSRWPNKRLHPEALKTFLEKIGQHFTCGFIFIWGDEEERELAQELESRFPERSRAVGNLSLPLWQVLMSKMKWLIATDSAGLHLAGAAGVPTFSVFGPSAANVYKPLGKQHGAFQGTCPYGVQFEKRCPQLRTCPTGACMRDISCDELFQSFLRFADKSL